MKYPLATALLALSSAPLMADVYNVEIDGSYNEAEIGKIESDVFVLKGSYFFGGVDDSKGPLAEAAFIDRASNVSLTYGNGDTDPGDAGVEEFGVGGRYVNKESGFIFSADYDLQQVDFKGSSKAELETFRFEAGLYVVEQGALTALFNTRRTDAEESSNSPSNVEKAKQYGVRYAQLIDFEGERSLKVDASYVYTDFKEDDDDSVSNLDIKADYYFTRQLSAGINLGYVFVSDSDTDDAPRYGINGKYFFNNQVSAYASLERVDFDESDETIDTMSIGLQGRF